MSPSSRHQLLFSSVLHQAFSSNLRLSEEAVKGENIKKQGSIFIQELKVKCWAEMHRQGWGPHSWQLYQKLKTPEGSQSPAAYPQHVVSANVLQPALSITSKEALDVSHSHPYKAGNQHPRSLQGQGAHRNLQARGIYQHLLFSVTWIRRRTNYPQYPKQKWELVWMPHDNRRLSRQLSSLTQGSSKQ